MKLNYRGSLAGFFMGFAMVTSAWLFYLESKWTSGAPTLPDPAHDLTFPLAIKGGGAHYVLCSQQKSIYYLFLMSFLSILLGILIVPKKNMKLSGKWFWGWISWDAYISTESKTGWVIGAVASFALIYLFGSFATHLISGCRS